MQDTHLLLSQSHLFGGQHIAVLQSGVLRKIVKPLLLDTGHIQHVQLGQAALQISGFLVGDVLGIQLIVAHILGQLQLLGGDEDEADATVAAHGGDEGVNGTAVLQVAAQTDGQIVQPAHLPGNGQQVRQGLGGMEMTAVTGVDDGNGGITGCHIGCTLFGMAHSDNIGIAADDFGGVGNALALGGGGGAGFAESDDAATQLQHSRLKAQAGTGGGFKEQGSQLLVGALVLVGFGIGYDITGSGDKIIQLFNGKIQNIDQTSHAFAPFTAR